jgi:hypothetical protein
VDRSLSIDEAVTHLYDAALRRMQRHGIPFVPLELVRDDRGWDEATTGDVVDAAVTGQPVVLGMLTADWMADGDRPAFGVSGMRFIGVRPV